MSHQRAWCPAAQALPLSLPLTLGVLQVSVSMSPVMGSRGSPSLQSASHCLKGSGHLWGLPRGHRTYQPLLGVPHLVHPSEADFQARPAAQQLVSWKGTFPLLKGAPQAAQTAACSLH